MGPAQRIPLCRNCPLLACGSRLSRPGPLCPVTLPPSTRPAGPGAKTTPTIPLWPGLPITGYLGVPHAQCWFGGAEGGPTEHRTSPRTGADEPRQMPPRFPAGTRSCGCSPPAGGTVPHSTLTGTGHGASGRLRAGPGESAPPPEEPEVLPRAGGWGRHTPSRAGRELSLAGPWRVPEQPRRAPTPQSLTRLPTPTVALAPAATVKGALWPPSEPVRLSWRSSRKERWETAFGKKWRKIEEKAMKEEGICFCSARCRPSPAGPRSRLQSLAAPRPLCALQGQAGPRLLSVRSLRAPASPRPVPLPCRG